VPVLGYFFIAGTLTYSFYSVMKNKMNSSKRKMK